MPFIVEINFPKKIFPMRISGSTQSKVLSMWVMIHWRARCVLCQGLLALVDSSSCEWLLLKRSGLLNAFLC